jgi:biotin carboxyl carrier protein
VAAVSAGADETPGADVTTAAGTDETSGATGPATATGADGSTGAVRNEPTGRLLDPRAVRVTPAASTGRVEAAPIVVEPGAVPVGPLPRGGPGANLAAGGRPPRLGAAEDASVDGLILVDGEPIAAALERIDGLHAVLVETRSGDRARRTPVMLLPPDGRLGLAPGTVRREVVIDGWSFELELESERRAALRERARRGHAAAGLGGPTEVRAIIPGRVESVSVVPGDAVDAGQQLLVVEAMKMQNELRAPRDGTVSQVAIGPGDTIEVGDLLLVLT